MIPFILGIRTNNGKIEAHGYFECNDLEGPPQPTTAAAKDAAIAELLRHRPGACPLEFRWAETAEDARWVRRCVDTGEFDTEDEPVYQLTFWLDAAWTLTADPAP